MSYPNVLNYTSTNKITIQDVRETCQEESDVLQQNIIDAINEVTKNSGGASQGITPLTQNITRAMGDYWFSIDGSVPPGGLPHLGHLVSRATYGDFYSWLSSTKTIMTDAEWLSYASSHGGCCPYYSSGDGSTTFRTPKYDNAFLKTISSINGAGVYEEEGLPNITGAWTSSYNISKDDGSDGIGAFVTPYSTSTGHYGGSNASSDWGYGLNFDASRSNAIYGSSEHVTPKNISFMIGVYAVGAIIPVGTTDAEKIMSGVTRVEGILDTKLNITTIHITEQTFSDTYWCRKWSNGWIEQGGVFQSVAGANQTFTFPTPFNSVNYYMFATNFQTTDAGICVFAFVPSTNTSCIYCTAYNGGYYSEQFRWYACGY